MPLRISLGRRIFEPSWLTTGTTLVLVVAFALLGRWQWDRGVSKQALWDAFARGADAPREVGATSLGSLPRFTHVSLGGRYDGTRQFLLDNRSSRGRAGYEALTPLRLDDGRTLLVDRGWVPFLGHRGDLPDVGFEPPAHVTVSGRLDALPSAGLASGHAAPDAGPRWPRVTSYPTQAELETAYGGPLEERILLLDAGAPFGYVRAWQPPGVPPQRNLSYAIQWWLFAVVLSGLYVFLNLRKMDA